MTRCRNAAERSALAARLALLRLKRRGAPTATLDRAMKRAAARAPRRGVFRAVAEAIATVGHDPRPMLPAFGESTPLSIVHRVRPRGRVPDAPRAEQRFSDYLRRLASQPARREQDMIAEPGA